MIAPGEIKNALSYFGYKELIRKLADEGLSTGHSQSRENLDFSKLNLHRMERLDKTFVPDAESVEAFREIRQHWNWFVLTEGWCGDCAQCLPVIHALASLTPNIEAYFLIRDEHPGIMNEYLTKGARSVPKLICTDAKTNEELFTWGPRPAVLQRQVVEMINRGIEKNEKGLMVQRWYNDDKGLTLERELRQLIGKHKK